MFKKLLSFTVIVCFFLTSLTPYPFAHAASPLNLPAPGSMINLSPAYDPVIIKGLTVHKDNPFLFDFIVDVGQDKMSGEPLKKEGEKLIKYFLASLAIPDKDVWVNLSPYEKDRMIPEVLGQTDMGRDLLEQDYILKQITASLIYPEKQLGKTFWDKVYAKAQQMYGTTQVPVNTFNKVWIMAEKAEVFEHNQTAFVVDSHLKIMLEEDYLAMQKHSVIAGEAKQSQQNKSHTIASQIIKEIIIPQLEKEVNTGKNFANLRQIFNSVILSSWYKKNLKEALLNQVYANKSKVKGINLNDPIIKQQIYEQYLKAYKKGVFNYIKEEISPVLGGMPSKEQGILPRKYFSGGITQLGNVSLAMTSNPKTMESTSSLVDEGRLVNIAAGALPTNAAMMSEEEIKEISDGYFRSDAGVGLKISARMSGLNVEKSFMDSLRYNKRSWWDGLSAGERDSIAQEAFDRATGINIPSSSAENRANAAMLAVKYVTPSIVKTIGDKETLRVDMDLLGGAKGHFVQPAGTSSGDRERPTQNDMPKVMVNVLRIHTEVLRQKIEPDQLAQIGQLMYQMDSGKNFLGAQATLAYQMADAWAVADAKGLGLYQLIREIAPDLAPKNKGKLRTKIQYNITNGKAHAGNALDMQEFMIVPTGRTIEESNRMADNVDRQLGYIYQALGLQADPDDHGMDKKLRGLEGGYSIPNFTKEKLQELYTFANHFDIRNLNLFELRDKNVGLHEFILNALMAAIKNAGYTVSKSGKAGTVALAIDVASSEMFDRESRKYNFEGHQISSEEFAEILRGWVQYYPIDSIEDPMDQNDWDGWMNVIAALGNGALLIGDDLLVTQADQLMKLIEKLREQGFIGKNGKVTKKIGILIKLNQNGFLTTGIDDPTKGYLGTLEVIRLARQYGIEIIISHRSKEALPEENEVSIADVAAGVDAYGLKSGDHIQRVRGIKEDRLANIEMHDIASAAMTAKSGRTNRPAMVGKLPIEYFGPLGDLLQSIGDRIWDLKNTDENSLVINFFTVNEKELNQMGIVSIDDLRTAYRRDLAMTFKKAATWAGVGLVTSAFYIQMYWGMGVLNSVDVRNIDEANARIKRLETLGAVYYGLFHLTLVGAAIGYAAVSHKKGGLDRATLVNPAKIENGGIDLNTSNGMQWKVSKEGNGVEMTVDPATIERIRHIGIDSLSPMIFRITPVRSIWPLVGLQAPVSAERVAGV